MTILALLQEAHRFTDVAGAAAGGGLLDAVDGEGRSALMYAAPPYSLSTRAFSFFC
jgi:hypothetical protein